MTRPVPRPSPDLPFDVVDAAGLFAAFAGALAIVVPYFVGLTGALAAVLLGLGLLRAAQGPFARADAARERRGFVIGLGVLALGWATFVVPGNALGGTQPLLLGTSGLPLWWVARRALPFGGG